MMVTDLAPIPTLIQRMGRVNRGAREPSVTPKPVCVIAVERPDPYLAEELELASNWLEQLRDSGPSVSQTDLARAFGRCEDNKGEEGQLDSAWLDGGPISYPASLREKGYTVSIIMEEDRRRCIAASGRVLNKEVTRYTIPLLLGPVAEE